MASFCGPDGIPPGPPFKMRGLMCYNVEQFSEITPILNGRQDPELPGEGTLQTRRFIFNPPVYRELP
jgi:hypothetical protein